MMTISVRNHFQPFFLFYNFFQTYLLNILNAPLSICLGNQDIQAQGFKRFFQHPPYQNCFAKSVKPFAAHRINFLGLTKKVCRRLLSMIQLRKSAKWKRSACQKNCREVVYFPCTSSTPPIWMRTSSVFSSVSRHHADSFSMESVLYWGQI